MGILINVELWGQARFLGRAAAELSVDEVGSLIGLSVR